MANLTELIEEIEDAGNKVSITFEADRKDEFDREVPWRASILAGEDGTQHEGNGATLEDALNGAVEQL